MKNRRLTRWKVKWRPYCAGDGAGIAAVIVADEDFLGGATGGGAESDTGGADALDFEQALQQGVHGPMGGPARIAGACRLDSLELSAGAGIEVEPQAAVCGGAAELVVGGVGGHLEPTAIAQVVEYCLG